MKKIKFNLSMISPKPTGIGIYALNLGKCLEELLGENFGGQLTTNSFTKNSSIYRIFWNIFILPFLVSKDEIVLSFSTYGSPFMRNQIIIVHDLISLNYPNQHKIQYLYFKFLVPRLLKSTLKIIAISNFTKSELVKFYNIDPDHIVVIRNGANYISTESNVRNFNEELGRITKGRKFFLTVGAVYRHKNIHHLLEAVKISKLYEYTFVILSKKGRFHNELIKHVELLQLKNIVILDYVTEDVLGMLYKSAEANIYLSLYEGFGFPPLEAANFNTISLVGNIPVMREIYGDSVIYTDPLSIKEIAMKLNAIARNQVNAKELKTSFIPLLSMYTWQKTASETFNLLKKQI